MTEMSALGPSGPLLPLGPLPLPPPLLLLAAEGAKDVFGDGRDTVSTVLWLDDEKDPSLEVAEGRKGPRRGCRWGRRGREGRAGRKGTPFLKGDGRSSDGSIARFQC